MRPRFDWWLTAAPTRTLRQLIPSATQHGTRRQNVQAKTRQRVTQSVATPATSATGEDTKKPVKKLRLKSFRTVQNEPPARVRHVAETTPVAEILGASTQEYGLRMSMSSGVPLLEPAAELDRSFQELQYQADVNRNGMPQDRPLLVDQEEHAHNYRLWVELLHFRRRLDGLAGVLDIWHGMRRRNVDLPTIGDEAEVLWEEFIHAAVANDGFHQPDEALHVPLQLFNHARDVKKRTGEHYNGLYKGLVGYLFRTDSGRLSKTRNWHAKMLKARLVSPENRLKRVASEALQNPADKDAFRQWKDMYKANCAERDCYDHVVPEAYERRGAEHTLKWHRLFIQHGDAPSAEVFELAAVQHLFKLDGDVSLPMKHSKEMSDDDTASPKLKDRVAHAPITRASMSALVGDVHGIKPKELSDGFVAKMFATRAFSLDIVIRGMTFFGVDTLGPLAVREMAIRTATPVDLGNRLNALQTAGIRLADGSAYIKLVVKVATEGHTELFNALLASDQHPEGYDDTRTQESLLMSHLEKGDWAQVHLTMTCLALCGVAIERRAANRLAQHYLRTRSWSLAASTIETMRGQKLALTSTTITYLWRYMLPERRRSKRPVESQRSDRPLFNPLDFVTNSYTYSDILISRVVPARLWVELLKRYGMAFRWDGVERLVLSLAERYRSRNVKVTRWQRGMRSVTTSRLGTGMLDEIFTPQMQQSIFTWGFRAAAVRGQLKERGEVIGGDKYLLPIERQLSAEGHIQSAKIVSAETTEYEGWTQGLRLLNQLSRRGLPIRDHIVRKAFYTRMWILFGPAYSTKAINILTRRMSELELSDFIRQGNSAYDGILTPALPRKFLDDDTPNEAVLKLAFFGRYRKTARRMAELVNGEHADVVAWTTDLIESPSDQRALSTRLQKLEWRRSHYRVVEPVQRQGLVAQGRRSEAVE
ncbi:hypothetical protein LTR97_008506 [Elasticomyces elasticus]|uniref:Pentatricopeptide repeat domain-containing protein n=1 Tax=Elasticomyces elasticus TaxID=574655 RepID=A0AAN7VYX2_9PEZI|nr:hypothetical protein LTR97_008506 [Elasticomyces elasticus]